MPTESDSKTSSESQRSRQGWLAKCGIALPILSVRDRHGSPGDPNRPVMTAADSPKKRKRVVSPFARQRIPIQFTEPKDINMSSNPVTMTDASPATMANANPVTMTKADLLKVSSSGIEIDDDIRKMRQHFNAALVDTSKINSYNDTRAGLLRLEDENSWDREARDNDNLQKRHAAAVNQEKKADTIIRAIREFERKVVFGNLASEAIPEEHTRDMGGQFLTNKERIDHESLLFQIAVEVPKGGLLHLHFNAELHPEQLLVQAREIEDMYIWSQRPLLTEKDLDETEMVFNVLDSSQVLKGVDIFSETYLGTGTNWKKNELEWKVWMPWSRFQADFAKHFPDKAAQEPKTPVPVGSTCCAGPAEPGSEVELNPAERWLKSKMVLSEEEAYRSTQTVNGVWARFNQATRCFKGLLNYEKVYKWYIGHAIERMIQENVMYAELRPMLLDKTIPSTDGKSQISNFEQMRLITKGVREKQAVLEREGRGHKFPFGLKIIYCTPRSIPKAMMQEELKQCIELKIKYPDLICGFDLVGAEDRPNHIGFYKEELLAFRRICEEKNLDIPFLFHAGETLLDTGGSSDPKNSNLYDAVALKSKRIGHGFALMKHPHLVEEFKKITGKSDGICIELCPISNELLHLCRNIKEHPFPELLAAGIPCTVNSDNPSLFSNSMSHEFYQIMVGAPTMSLYSWKQLAKWSIDYSCLNEDQQKEGHKILTIAWEEFCAYVVNTYGDLMVNGEIDEDKFRAKCSKGACANPK